MESIKQATQRKVTQLRMWLGRDECSFQQRLSDLQKSNPDKDAHWCLEQLWSEQQSLRC